MFLSRYEIFLINGKVCHIENNQFPTNETIMKYYIEEDKQELTEKKLLVMV